MQKKTKHQKYYNRAVHSLSPLQSGQDVQIYDKKVGRLQKSDTVLGLNAP